MIITEQGEKHLSPTAVSLTVTGLQVKQNRPKALTCSTSCTLTSVQQHFLWYKNGGYTGKDTDYNEPFILSSNNKGGYTCSVFGYNNIRSSPLSLKVRVISSTESDGPTVTLMCSSTCTLPNNPTYIWYKNGQPVTNKHTRHNKLYLKCSEDTGNYSCAVRGHEQLRSPVKHSVTVSPVKHSSH
ncbi:hypothetical protein SRHO_G00308710 [Serrasalmus rhombeus]